MKNLKKSFNIDFLHAKLLFSSSDQTQTHPQDLQSSLPGTDPSFLQTSDHWKLLLLSQICGSPPTPETHKSHDFFPQPQQIKEIAVSWIHPFDRKPDVWTADRRCRSNGLQIFDLTRVFWGIDFWAKLRVKSALCLFVREDNETSSISYKRIPEEENCKGNLEHSDEVLEGPQLFCLHQHRHQYRMGSSRAYQLQFSLYQQRKISSWTSPQHEEGANRGCQP